MKKLFKYYFSTELNYVVRRFQFNLSKHNLEVTLLNMPKEVKHTAALKKHRQKLKEKQQKYSANIVNLQVLGSGANGAPRSLYVFTDASRYMFNCGEGTQRLSHEHKMKLAKLEHIFFTHGSWENIGGLPGISLTVQDVGVPEITIHGPKGIADIFSATRRFIILKDLSVKTADYDENHPYFEDKVMKVQYVPLSIGIEHVPRRTAVSLDRNGIRYDSLKEDEESSYSSCTTDDDIDYYAHERNSGKFDEDLVQPKKKKKKKKKKRSVSVNNDHDTKRRCVESVGNVAMSYICKLHPKPGTLNLEACVDKGVPPGPLLGRLKSGEDITLPNGTVVKSSDVTSPDDPGPIFIVVECPDERFLEPLEKEVSFTHHQSQATCENDFAFLVVHFTPPNITSNPRYKNWMNKFPARTRHLFINESSECMGSIAVHRIQHKLNMLETEIFPLLPNRGTPILESGTDLEENVKNGDSELCNDLKISEKTDLNAEQSSCSTSSSSMPFIYQAKTLSLVQLRPNEQLDSSNELAIRPDEYTKEVFSEDMAEALNELHLKLKEFDPVTNEDQYPSVTFLGTGSCIPNKTRNTSGILLNISENQCMLLDCGEGTYGQLVRFHENEKLLKVLSSMQAIFISHLHADHHIGLIGVLKARRKFTSNKQSTLFLIAPKQIMTWLKYYNDHFEQILQQVEIIPNSDLINGHVSLPYDLNKRLCHSLNMTNILTTGVKHCPNSFGVAFEHSSGWKITYSGDTMPCDSLVELGKDTTLLIHEATMEDELVHEARRKMHSTTSEAIDIGKRMNAKFTLLTHFSQRYATLPRFNENILKDGVGIAFDNMRVRFCDLPKLPLMYPALKLMFSAHQEELEEKANKRHLKRLRMEDSRSPSRSRSPSAS